MQHLYDISPPLSQATPVWPGDTPLSREILCDLTTGASVTLSTFRGTVHLGSHADGPNHYSRTGVSIGEMPLDHYLGLCMVVDAPVARGSRVLTSNLKLPAGGSVFPPRVLIRTGTFPDPAHWNDDFAGLSVELIDWLSSRGVRTIGVDAPSVDTQDSKDLPAHNAIARHNIAILEGLILRDVPAGHYELIALPLRLMGFDASPVRAVLRTLP